METRINMLKWNSHVMMEEHGISFLTKNHCILAILVAKLLASEALRHLGYEHGVNLLIFSINFVKFYHRMWYCVEIKLVKHQ